MLYTVPRSIMPGDTCIVCGNTRARDPEASFHRFPSNQARRQVWLRVFQLTNEQLKDHDRVCSRHFPGADSKKDPQMNLGKRFASPKKRNVPRAKRAKRREVSKQLSGLWQIPSADSSRSSTPAPVATPITLTSLQSAADQGRMLTACIGEQLLGNYQVHELPSDSTDDTSDYLPQSHHSLPETSKGSELVVNTALLARIEALEAENQHLKKELKTHEAQHQHFRISQVRDNNKLFRFFTGFASYMHFLALFEFLGPVVNELNYWGSKETSRRRHRTCKLDPENDVSDCGETEAESQISGLSVSIRYFTGCGFSILHNMDVLPVPPSEGVRLGAIRPTDNWNTSAFFHGKVPKHICHY